MIVVSMMCDHMCHQYVAVCWAFSKNRHETKVALPVWPGAAVTWCVPLFILISLRVLLAGHSDSTDSDALHDRSLEWLSVLMGWEPLVDPLNRKRGPTQQQKTQTPQTENKPQRDREFYIPSGSGVARVHSSSHLRLSGWQLLSHVQLLIMKTP